MILLFMLILFSEETHASVFGGFGSFQTPRETLDKTRPFRFCLLACLIGCLGLRDGSSVSLTQELSDLFCKFFRIFADQHVGAFGETDSLK